jgi:transcriptional regulator with XRE-family HTH domain
MDEPKPMTELTRIRDQRGLSQQGLADASGVNKATINQIERGRRSPNARTLEKLAAALGVEMGEFFPLAQTPLPDFFEDERPEGTPEVVVKDSRATTPIQTTATAKPKKEVRRILSLVWARKITPEEGTRQLFEDRLEDSA